MAGVDHRGTGVRVKEGRRSLGVVVGKREGWYVKSSPCEGSGRDLIVNESSLLEDPRSRI